MTELPIVMLPSGLQPQSPASLRSQLVALVAASNPDYTDNLPSSLIEDIASTDVGALIISDQFLVDLVNSITPYGANPFLLNQLGNLYGVQPDEATNTSVYVQFSGPPPGFLIAKGFVVGDGTYQYYCQEGSVIGAGGMSPPVFAVAGITGSWSIPPGTVTQVITSVPAAYTLNVTNPEAGTPAVAAETVTQFRTRVQRAGLAASTGMTRYLKTLCANIQGVQDRLVSVQQDTQAGKWIVLVGGGDPYEVGAAINAAVPDVTALTGSTIRIIGITNTNPAVITTENNHNLLNGQVYTISQVQGILAINGSYAVTDISKTTFSVPFDATTQPAYTLGGVVTPNPINITVSIIDYPNTYPVSFINPFPQHVALVITWTTRSEERRVGKEC